MNQTKKRNIAVKENRNQSFCKGVACIFIVLLHCQLPGKIGYVVDVLSRFAVPYFFLISGYYLIGDHSESKCSRINRINRKLWSNVRLLVRASFVFLFYQFISNCLINKMHISQLISEFFYPTGILLMLFFNRIAFASHLWFVASLIYAYLVVILLIHFDVNFERKSTNVGAFLVLIGGILLREVALDNPVMIRTLSLGDVSLYRNWIFLSTPLLVIGNYIRLHKNRFSAIEDKFYLGLAFFGLFLSFFEKRFAVHYFGTHLDLYIGTILFTVSIFIISVKYPHKCISKRVVYIGSKLSLNIYIYHVLIIMIVTNHITGDFVNLRYATRIIVAIFILLASILLSWILDHLKIWTNRLIRRYFDGL